MAEVAGEASVGPALGHGPKLSLRKCRNPPLEQWEHDFGGVVLVRNIVPRFQICQPFRKCPRVLGTSLDMFRHWAKVRMLSINLGSGKLPCSDSVHAGSPYLIGPTFGPTLGRLRADFGADFGLLTLADSGLTS